MLSCSFQGFSEMVNFSNSVKALLKALIKMLLPILKKKHIIAKLGQSRHMGCCKRGGALQTEPKEINL